MQNNQNWTYQVINKMPKRFSTLDTITILLSYPEVMYKSIELMDRIEDRYINEATLAITVREYIKPLDSVESERLTSAFDTDNLTGANIISDIEKRKDGNFLLFQDPVLALFRLCEASLYQELTDTKLRSRLVSLRDVRDRLGSSSFMDNDLDYSELTKDIMEQLSTLLTMLRNNIVAMQRIGEKFEEMTATASKSPDEFANFRQTMFENTTRLFDRHIKPTLSFLDPSIRLSDGTNLFNTIAEIKSSYDINNKHTIADQIFHFSMSFSNIFRPVQKVERQVDHFLRKTRVGMLQYNAMEFNYQKLKELYEKTKTISMKHKYMDAQDFAKSSGYLLGLKQHSKPQPYQFGDSTSYYENIFSEIALRLSSLEIGNPTIFKGESFKDNLAIEKLERAELLFEWINAQPFRESKDIIATMHYRLEDWLKGYVFTDLLTVIIRLSHKSDWNYHVVTTNKFSYVTINEDAFVYRRRKLIEVRKENE